jgi:hypothetical protein
LTELRQGNRIKGEVDVQAAKALDDTVEAQYKEIGLLP